AQGSNSAVLRPKGSPRFYVRVLSQQQEHELRARTDAEFAIDPRERPLDRLVAQLQLVRDLVIRPAAPHGVDDLPFLDTQLVEHASSVAPRSRGFPRD